MTYAKNCQINYAILIFMFLLFHGIITSCSNGGSSDSGYANTGEDLSNVTFSQFQLNYPNSSSVEISFVTSRETSCEIIYGPSENQLSDSATDSTMMAGELRAEHTVLVDELLPTTTYYYKARAIDATENIYFSELREFTTQDKTSNSSTLRNIALLSYGTIVSDVSSNYGGVNNADMWGANAAIDGLLSTEWSSNADGDNAALTLDLGRERQLVGFGIRSRKMTDGSSIIQSVQLIFNDSHSEGPFVLPDPDQLYQFNFVTPISAQIVKVEAVSTTGGNTGLKEFQLLATTTDQ